MPSATTMASSCARPCTIEQPHIQRFIRRKLAIITRQQNRIQELETEINRRDDLLKRLAAEYVMLGKECEHEHMLDAAIRNYQKALDLYPDAFEAQPIRNYQKALDLYPDAFEAQRRIKKLTVKKK